ncbi:hypothetical protein [Amaricoccus sp. W119]|uniref:hypothetical protein n=1 Tax=Amaricoccus sp. W119 TaxID=3391833 RepID=UPI0039A72553
MFDPKTFAFDPAKFNEALKSFGPEAFQEQLAKLPSFDEALATQKKATETLVRDAQAAVDAWTKLVQNQFAIAEEALNATLKAAAPARA